MTKDPKLSHCIGTQEAARRCKLTDGAIKWAIENDLLPALKIGRTWVLHVDTVKAFAKTERKPGPVPAKRKPGRPKE